MTSLRGAEGSVGGWRQKSEARLSAASPALQDILDLLTDHRPRLARLQPLRQERIVSGVNMSHVRSDGELDGLGLEVFRRLGAADAPAVLLTSVIGDRLGLVAGTGGEHLENPFGELGPVLPVGNLVTRLPLDPFGFPGFCILGAGLLRPL